MVSWSAVGNARKASKTQIAAAARSLAAFQDRNPQQADAAIRKRARELGVTFKVLRDAVWRIASHKRDSMSVDQHLAEVFRRNRWGF